MLQPPESSAVPPALHLHLWHYLADTSVCVLQRRIAQHGEGDMLCWFHLKPRLSESAQWSTFVQRRPAACFVIDLPSAEAASDLQHCHRWFVLRYGTGIHRYLAGHTNSDPELLPARVRKWWCAWRYYLQSCGHMVHSHYVDLRLQMLPG